MHVLSRHAWRGAVRRPLVDGEDAEVLQPGMHACMHVMLLSHWSYFSANGAGSEQRMHGKCRESFFCYCRTRGGYSGVATFCRADVATPVAALDGFSGEMPFKAPCQTVVR